MKRFVIIVISFLLAIAVNAQKMEISPALVSATVGQEITVSVVASEFSSDVTSLSAIEFYIDFNNTVLNYTGASNFSPLLPASQWFYSAPGAALSRFSCNWAEPTLTNLSIPDGTTLFDLSFLYLGGESALAFDSAASVFVHIDGVNFIEVPVNFTDGYVQLGVGIDENKTEENPFVVNGRNELVIPEDLNGFLMVTNLNGQVILDCNIEGNINRHFTIQQKGILIVTMTNQEKRISGKVLIF